jgi:hypothetical protein
MKLFLFILLSLIFINGAKSESITTKPSISIYNNDFKLFGNILEREKRESNSLSERNNKEENDNNSKKEIQPKTKEDAIQNNNKNDDINNSKSPVNQDKNNNGKSKLTDSKNKKSTKNNLKRLLKRLKKIKKIYINRKNINTNERPKIQDINERPPIQDINERPKIEAFKINGQTFLRCKRAIPGSSCDKSLDGEFTAVGKNNPKSKNNPTIKYTDEFNNQFKDNYDKQNKIKDIVGKIKILQNFKESVNQDDRSDFGIHKMTEGSKLEGYFTADFEKAKNPAKNPARILMKFNDDENEIEVYGLVDTHNKGNSGEKWSNVLNQDDFNEKSNHNQINPKKYLKLPSYRDPGQHVYVKIYEKPLYKNS